MSGIYKRMLLAVIGAAVLASFVAGCGRGVVAKVNGRKITKEEYYTRLEHLPVPVNNNQRAEAGAIVLEKLINEQLLLDLAKDKGVPPTDEEVDERYAQVKKQPNFAAQLKQLGITKEQFKEMLRVEQAAFNLQTRGIKVSEKEVKDVYEKQKMSYPFTTPEQAAVAVILTKSKADADKAIQMLKNEASFGSVARKISIDQQSAANDGRIPVPVTRGDDRSWPKVIQDKVLSTPRGKYTQPISFKQGTYVIFQVLRRTPQKTRPFKEIEYALRQEMMVAKGREKKINVDEELAKFREKAKMDVNIDRYEKQMKENLKKKQAAPAPTAGTP